MARKSGTKKSPKKRHGRPTKLTPEVQASIIADIGKCLFLETAAANVKLPPQTLYNWLKAGERGDPPYDAFLEAYKNAERKAQLGLLEQIAQRVPGWQALAWLLERRWYELWGRRAPDYDAKKTSNEVALEKMRVELEEARLKVERLKAGEAPDGAGAVINVVIPDFGQDHGKGEGKDPTA